MSIWLHYWKRNDVDRFLRISNFKIDCTGSDQSRFHNQYKAGDIVWFHSILENNQHVILGRLVLDQKMSKEQASNHVGRPFAASIKFETYWVSLKPWHSIQTITITDIARQFQFEPHKPLPPDYTGQHFQSIRELTLADHNILQERWDAWME